MTPREKKLEEALKEILKRVSTDYYSGIMKMLCGLENLAQKALKDETLCKCGTEKELNSGVGTHAYFSGVWRCGKCGLELPKPEDEKTDVDKLHDLVKIQVKCSKDDPTDPYMRGMANGLICALAVFKKWEPTYIEKPQPEVHRVEKEEKYPCAKCGKLRTKDEGGTTFTICDECWEKEHHKSQSGKIEELDYDIDSHALAQPLRPFYDKINEIIRKMRGE